MRAPFSAAATVGALVALLTAPGCTDAVPGGDIPPGIVSSDDASDSWFEGRVVDARIRAPIAGVTVEVTPENFPGPPLPAIARGVTDEDGEFAIPRPDSPPSGTALTMVIHAEGWAPTTDTLGIPPHRPDRPIRLGDQELERGTRVQGVVLLPNGRPASTGDVLVHDRVRPGDYGTLDEDLHPVPAPIGEDGRFAVVVAGPRFALRAEVPGYPLRLSDVLRTDSESVADDVTLGLEPPDPMRGRILDASEIGVPGAVVYAAMFALDPFGYTSGSSRRVATTDEDGEFELHSIPRGPGRITLNVTHPEHPQVFAPAISERGPVELRVLDGRVLRARFTDRDGAPVFPAHVEFSTLDDEGSISFRRIRDAYRSDPIPVGSTAGWLRPLGFANRAIAWPAGPGEHDLGTIALEEGASLRVVVRKVAGEPVPDAIVNLVPVGSAGGPRRRAIQSSVFHVTDENGRAEIRGLLPQPQGILVRADGFRPELRVARARTGEPGEIVLTLLPAGGIETRVIDAAGNPVPDAQLVLTLDLHEFEILEIPADDDGRIVRPDVPCRTPLSGVVRAPGFLDRPVDLEPLAPAERRVLPDIRIERGHDLTLTVVDAEGHAVPAATVHCRATVRRDDGSRFRRRRDTTDPSGTVRFRGLPEVPHEISVEAEGFVEAERTAVPGPSPNSDPIVLDALPRSVVRGRLRQEGGAPVTEGTVMLEPTDGDGEDVVAELGPDGTFEAIAHFDGPVRLTVSCGLDIWHSAEHEAARAEDLPEEFVVPDLATVVVRVVDTDGRVFPREVSLDVLDEDGEAFAFDWKYDPGRGLHSVELVGIPTTPITVVPSCPGVRFTVEPEVVRADPGERVEILIRVVESALPVQCTTRVLDPSGGPVAGAMLQIQGESSDPLGFSAMMFEEVVLTGRDGTAELWRIPGAEALVIASAPGFVERERHLRGLDEVTIVLEYAASLRVRAVEEDGRPTEDVEIEVVAEAKPDEGFDLANIAREIIDEAYGEVFRTDIWGDGDGWVPAEDLTPGIAAVRVETAECYETFRSIELEPRDEETIEVTLPPAFTITVDVRRGEDPVPGAEVEVESLDEEFPGETEVETDAEGRATVRLRRPGRYRFESGSVRREVEVEAGSIVVLMLGGESGD